MLIFRTRGIGKLCFTRKLYLYTIKIHNLNPGGAQSLHKPHAIEFPYSISYLKDPQSNGEEFTRETLSHTHSSLVLRKLFQKVKFLYFIVPPCTSNVRNPSPSPLLNLSSLLRIDNLIHTRTKTIKPHWGNISVVKPIMLIKGHQIKVPILFLVNLVLVFFVSSVNAVESRKLDENPVPATNGTEEKCGSCGTVYPSPPPPAIPPPSPPPPKKTPTQYCPPPPPSSFIYITGPPGNLYPVDEDFNAAACHRRSFVAVLLPLFVGMLFTFAFWWFACEEGNNHDI